MKVYISGGITNVPNYMEHFEEAEKALLEKGFEVVNPAKVNGQMPNLTHDEYMAMSFCMLDLCEGIHMLDGWRESKGACMEYGYAIAKDKFFV